MSTEVDPEKNPLLPGVENPGYDGTGEEIEMEKLRDRLSKLSSGSFNLTSSNRTCEETSFGGEPSGTMSLDEREKNVDAAWERIKSKFPKFNPAKSPFTVKIEDFDRVMVRLNRNKGKYYPLFSSDGEVNTKLPKTIINSLGLSAEDIIKTNEEEIVRRNKKISELQDQQATTDKNQIEGLSQTIDEEQDEINQLERANEEIEQRMIVSNKLVLLYKNSQTRLNIMRLCAKNINDITIFFLKFLYQLEHFLLSRVHLCGNRSFRCWSPCWCITGAIGLICGILSVFTGAVAKKVSHKIKQT